MKTAVSIAFIIIIGALPVCAQTQLPIPANTQKLMITPAELKTKIATTQARNQTSSDLKYPGHHFQAKRVTETQGKVFLSGSENYTFTAGDSIVLRPGFEVDSAAEFTAEIKPVASENFPAIISKSSLVSNEIPVVAPEKNGSIQAFTLFPNPASEQFHIEYKVTQTAQVSLVLYTLQGTPVQIFMQSKQQEPGKYKLASPVPNIPSGLYVVTLKINNRTINQRIVLR